MQAFRGLGYIGGAVLAAAVLNFAAQIVIARALGPASYGQLAAAVATAAVAFPLSSFGAAQHWLRLFARNQPGAVEFIAATYSYVAICTLFASCGLLAWAGLHSDTQSFAFTVYLLPTVWLYAAHEIYTAWLRVQGRDADLAKWLLFPVALRAVAATLAAVIFLESFAVVWSHSVVALMVIAVLFAPLSRLYRLSTARATAKRVWGIFRSSWPYGIEVLAYPIFFQSALLTLAWTGADHDAGQIGVLLTVLAGVYLVPDVLWNKYLLPRLHGWSMSDRRRYFDVVVEVGALFVSVGVLIAALLMLVGPSVLWAIFGRQYEVASELLTLLAFAVPIRFASSVFGVLLITEGKVKLRALGLVVAGIGVVLAASLLQVTQTPARAAVWGILTGELLLLLMFAGSVRVVLKGSLSRKRSSGVAVLGYYGMENFGDDLFVRVLDRKFDTTVDVTFAAPVLKSVINHRSIAYFDLRQYGAPWMGRLIRAWTFLAVVLRSEKVVLGGGSVLSQIRVRDALLLIFARLKLVRLFALGVSIGPFRSRIEERWVRMFLHGFEALHIRDRRSFEWAKDNLEGPRLVAGRDLIFSGVWENRACGARSRIVYFPCHRVSDLAGNDNLRLARIIGEFARRRQMEVLVCALNVHPIWGDSMLVTQAISALTEAEVRCQAYFYDGDAEKIIELAAQSAMVVSVRLHGALAGELVATPTILLAYHAKCRDVTAQCEYIDVLDLGAERGCITESLERALLPRGVCRPPESGDSLYSVLHAIVSPK